jgi:hypothetical protein
MKYVYFIPKGGMNDILSCIQIVYNYCIQHQRTLLVDTKNSHYKINFSDFFNLEKCDIIWDINIIHSIIKNLSVYPKIDCELMNINQKDINYIQGIYFFKKNTCLGDLPNDCVDEDIILHSRCGGGKGSVFFINHMSLKDNLKQYCNQKLTLQNYLCIQVRNTDLKCDYDKLYQDNKEFIHSYHDIYVCTDDKYVVDYFKSKNLNVHCFTTFPDKEYKQLHNCNFSGDILIQDLFVDIFMATNSQHILSNSKGGFVKFLRDCHLNKDQVLNKLKM